MGNPFFRFKQFEIWHDRCAMKVGTDGVLLGAWTDVSHSQNVLDIGTGSGLIALMIAQRCRAKVTGVEIDAEAAKQACENVALSPWKGRVSIRQADITAFEGGKYDTILSNPPYFREQVYCSDDQRNAARHTGVLTFEALLDAVIRLLTDDGCFSVILPFEAAGYFIGSAAERHLYPMCRTNVQTRPGISPKRVLLTLSRNILPCKEDTLVIESEPRIYSPDFIQLVKDFYLAF